MNRFRLQSWHFVIAIIAFFLFTLLVSHIQISNHPESENHEAFIQFDGELAGEEYSYLFFYADDCKFCKKMRHNLEQSINSDNERIRYYEVNVYDSPEHYAGFGISGVPSILIYKESKEMLRVVGIVSAGNLKRIGDKILKR